MRLAAPTREPLQSTEIALDANRLVRRFGDTLALDGVDLAARRHETVAVVGPSGCGKSTLLELCAGLQEPDFGSVAVGTAESAEARLRQCAYMPQRDLLLDWRDALGNAALALECAGVARREARQAAAPLFERFGLSGFENAYPRALSGGMRQRVAFVRTLLAQRPILLLDEPFGALDSITRAGAQDWLQSALASEPRTVVLVTHDVEEALFLSDRTLVLSPRPAHVVAEIGVPFARPRARRQTITSADFTALKEQAMEALGC